MQVPWEKHSRAEGWDGRGLPCEDKNTETHALTVFKWQTIINFLFLETCRDEAHHGCKVVVLPPISIFFKCQNANKITQRH